MQRTILFSLFASTEARRLPRSLDLSTEMHDHFDYMVPNAATKGGLFLSTVRDRCNSAGLGLTLAPKNAGKERVVMRGEIVLGNAWKGKVPFYLEVFADAQGPLLQVGYQLSTKDTPSYLGSLSDSMFIAQRKVISDPSTQRQLSGTIQAFHLTVFEPTLTQLVQAVGGAVPARGFLGA